MLKMKVPFELIGTGLAAVLILASCQLPGSTAAPAATQPAPTNPPAPAATATPVPAATDTPAPADTATATTAPAPTDTPAPTAQVVAQVVPSINAYCRKGPGTGYFAIFSLQKGTAYNVIGRTDTNTWWLVQASPSLACWEGDPNASLQGPVDQAPVVLVPPLPGMATSFDRTFVCTATNLKVSLVWAPVENITGYSIYRNGDLLASVGANQTSFEDSEAPNGVDLLYELKAFNDYGASPSLTTNVSACGSS
jgi:hypothetical protein